MVRPLAIASALDQVQMVLTSVPTLMMPPGPCFQA